MPGITDAGGPSYISSHSADVILSDIRPIKLKIEALRAINVLLDEFLYSILSTARSLSTDKLRASLLSLLPTTLGKEALLEAEVELRAYWDRTGPIDATVPPLEDDSATFQLQWAFELLRLKCEAYSTLNESDEDPGAESRINDRLSSAGGSQPKASLMAPAALYLTAILEALCEHILSNVGRVASRDSSRTSATVQDLFVALCEDHSIYSLFKSMKVYEQIEHLSKAPKPRRSKSFSRSDRLSRTSSPHQDSSSTKDSPARSRLSSETTLATGAGSVPNSNAGSRSSFEKTRAMKMFMANTRTSSDRDGESQNGHRKTDSVLSENTKQTLAAYNDTESFGFEDEVMQKEFDDLMRSSSTMKVSLTPDRLKTMEVYKQEKDQRGNKRPVPLSFKSDPDSSAPQPRATGRRPSLLRVDSIKEDDEESPTKPPFVARARQASVTSPPAGFTGANRVRSVSTSGATPRPPTKLSRTSTTSPVPVPPPPSSIAVMQQRRRVVKGDDPFPPRTRRVQQNRESIDLDDVMGGSDDDDYPPVALSKPAKQATTPNRPGHHAVSAGTRDLMDFLAEGPPEVPGSRDMVDFLADGPPSYHTGTESSKPKGSGRLQRMISKLSLGNSERSRGASDDSPKSKAPIRPNVQPKSSVTNLSSLANRPVPPRPRPISPPASPSRDSSDDQDYRSSRSRVASIVQRPPDTPPIETLPPTSLPRDYSGSVASNRRPPLPSPTNGHGNKKAEADDTQKDSPPSNVSTPNVEVPSPIQPPISPIRPPRTSSSRKPAPVYAVPTTTPRLSGTDAHEVRRLLSKATTADECRLLYDMFLARSGIPVEPADCDVPYPSPSSSVAARGLETTLDTALEHSLLELLLGGGPDLEISTRKRRAPKRSRPEVALKEASPTSSHGDKKIPNGAHRFGNGEFHSSSGNPHDDREVITNSPKSTSPSHSYSPVSVGT